MAYCGKCGTEINNGVKFCPNCGTQLDGMNGTQRVSNPVQGEPKKKMALWKKIGIGFIIFAIIGALSQPKDGKTESNDETNAPQKTEKVTSDSKKAKEEQVRHAKEEEAERKAKEEAERQEQEKKARKEEILRHGYKYGKEYGASLQKRDAINKERWCKERFLDKCEAPRTPEEMELYREFKEQFYKGWEDALF